MPLNPPQGYRKTAFTHRRGTRAAQPLATDVLNGTLYFVTDEGVLERSNGTIWESYGGSGFGNSSPVVFFTEDGSYEPPIIIPGQSIVGPQGVMGMPGIDGEVSQDPFPFYPPLPQDLTPLIVQGRLTLETGVPVSVTDQNTKDTVYLAPYAGNRIALYNGFFWEILSFTQKSIQLGPGAAIPYDFFAYNNAGVVALEAVAWTNATTRATALAVQDGVLVKSGALTRRYIGSGYSEVSTGDNSLFTDSERQRHLYNYYNRVNRPIGVRETTNTWTYTTATFRQANGAAGNQVEIMNGWLGEESIDLQLVHGFSSTSTIVVVAIGAIGEDSTTAFVAGCLVFGNSTYTDAIAGVLFEFATAKLVKAPPLGFHYYAWLEYSTVGSAASVTTFYGDGGGALLQTGIAGTWRC